MSERSEAAEAGSEEGARAEQMDAAEELTEFRRFGRTRFMVPHPAFDWYVRGAAIAAVLTSSVFGGMAWWYQHRFFHAMGLERIVGNPELVSQYERVTLLADATVMLMCAVVLVFSSMFLVHKILGPVYRLRNHMQSIIDGAQVSELHFRSRDQLNDLSATYNELLHQLDLIEPKDVPPVHARPDEGSVDS